jgi:nicotinate phosphoribosyltransferase
VHSALATDLYQLTMMAGYQHGGITGRSTFELFVRRLPAGRAFLVVAGMEQALDLLERLRFTDEEIAYLRTVPALASAPEAFFAELLPSFRFSGDVWAVAEGEVVFAREPMLRVTAPAAEAQLVETALLATLTFQASIASKAARVVHAAAGRGVIEFGSRRAHGLEAALYAARASYVAGCDATSNVEAGHRFGIPVSGTMAHSWVMSFPREIDAFRAYLELFGEQTTLLIDTYDTAAAAHAIVASGLRPGAVRLDSGDFVALSREVRRILDGGGLRATRIIVSGDLDEDRIAELLAEGAPVDAFGVGTALSTSKDEPALGGVYKLVEIERDGAMAPVLKLSAGKHTLPGSKQVWRVSDRGHATRDVLALEREPSPGGRPLLAQVMRGGRRIGTAGILEDARRHARHAVGELPAAVRRLHGWDEYPVQVSDALESLATTAAQGRAPRAT